MILLLVDGQVGLVRLVAHDDNRGGVLLVLGEGADDGEPVLAEADDGLLAGDIVDQDDEIALPYLGPGVVASVKYFGEDVPGVGTHVGRKDDLLVNRRGLARGQIGDDGAHERCFADCSCIRKCLQSPTTASLMVW